MLEHLLRTLTGRSPSTTARLAAEGTYETIRRGILYARGLSQDEMDEQILSTLASRRAWHRTDERTFVVRWADSEAEISARRPLEIGKLFRDAAEAEIAVFCPETDAIKADRIQDAGRQELRRLFDRDGLPWVEASPESGT